MATSSRLARSDSEGDNFMPPPMLRSSTSAAAAAAAATVRKRTMRAATCVAEDSQMQQSYIIKMASEQTLDDEGDGHGIPIPGAPELSRNLERAVSGRKASGQKARGVVCRPNLLTAAAADFAYVDARAEKVVLTSDIGLLMSKISGMIDDAMAQDLATDIAVHGTSTLARTPDEREFLRRQSIAARKERMERKKQFGVVQHVLQR